LKALLTHLQISWHFRGPLNLLQFASYTPSSNTSISTRKARRKAHAQKHAHAVAHRHAHTKRAVGEIVTATINGQAVSWTNEYDGLTTSTPTPEPPAYSAPPLPESSESATPDTPAPSGCWARNGYYDSASQTSQGIVFLNHNGGSGSGIFDYAFGASLSYADSTGCTGSSSPQTLAANTTLPSNAEIVIMTDKICSHDSCGYSRPGTVAYEGFDGESKAFMFEFSMPDSGETTTDTYDPVNMPAIWALNAQIPRTLQYGNEDCSCWSTGCGEFDMFEVLASGDARCKSTYHGNKAGGDSNYFARPMTGSIKVGMILFDDAIHIKVLDLSVSFDQDMDASVIDEILGSTSVAGPGVSLFSLAGAASG
jgi:hypothetical protein